jgi:hypothetical protein
MRITTFLLVLAASAAASAVGEGAAPDPRLVAGNEIVEKFPEFPTDARDIAAVMRITLPENYDLAKVYPVFLFMNGGKGSSANLPELVENRDFISVGMPIFVANDAKPEGRYIVGNRDAANLWKYHKQMLERLYEVVPNINRKLGLAAGFSNGANSIRCLVELTDGEYHQYFNRYIFCEGGTLLTFAENLNGPILGVAGDGAMGIVNRPGNVKDTVVDPALARGVDAEYILMKDTKHEFNEAYYPQVREWIYRKVLRGGLEANRQTMKDAVEAESWREALDAYENLVLLTGEPQAERGEANVVLEAVNAAGNDSWSALRKSEPSAEEVNQFVAAWQPCRIATTAMKFGNPMGEEALAELLSGEGELHWEKLGAFIEMWEGFPVEGEARAELASEGLAAKVMVEAMGEGDEKIAAWRDLANRYPDTPAAVDAAAQLDDARWAEGMKAFLMSDKEAKVARIEELMVLFSGTRHERAMKNFHRSMTVAPKEWRPWVLEREARRAQKASGGED